MTAAGVDEVPERAAAEVPEKTAAVPDTAAVQQETTAAVPPPTAASLIINPAVPCTHGITATPPHIGHR